MWLYVPSVSVPEPEDSNSDWVWPSAMPSDLSVSWSGKPLLPRSWSHVCRTAPYLRLLSGIASPPLMLARGVEWWIASLQDSPVNRGVSPVDVLEPQTPVGYGMISSASAVSAPPSSSSWRMSQVSFPGEGFATSSLVSLTRAGSMRNGTCSARSKRVPPTNVSGFSFWPLVAKLWSTPGVPSSGGRARSVIEMQTGKSQSTGRKIQRDLESQAKLWEPIHLDQMTEMDGLPSSPQPRDLNPLFVEWLMNWPEGWTDPLHAVFVYDSRETASYH